MALFETTAQRPLEVIRCSLGRQKRAGYLDIHLNATTRWKDVPEPVWNYTLGGYQVLKKWLSYRESALLGRPLTSDEAQHFTHYVRRITSILALHEKLDAHYGVSV